MDEHKLTMSFINGNPGFVVKANTAEEIDELLKSSLPIFKKFKTAVDTYREKQMAESTPPPGQTQDNMICKIHNTPMIWKTGFSKKSNKPYAFWACPTKNPDGSFCQYKP